MKILGMGCILALSLALSLVRSQAVEKPHSISTEFFEVLRSGDLNLLREALDKGAPALGRDAAGTTALMHTAAYGGVPAMRMLIERGADVNASNHSGATALMRAVTDPEKVRLLLAHGANVNSRSVFGNSALILAARPRNSDQAVEALLAAGADAGATNHWGANALMAAAAGGNVRTVRMLLAHGADVNAQPAANHEAFIFGGGRSALMWAAFRGDLAMMNVLLEAGADVNGLGMLGTPLAQAAWSDQKAAAQLLLDRGANVNIASPFDGYSPLHWAASSEQTDPSLVKLLLQHGANPNLGGGENIDAFLGTLQTPLMLANRRGETAILAELRRAGATNAVPDRIRTSSPPPRTLTANLTMSSLEAINRAVPPLQKTALESKKAFVRHSSRQDCTSCHQQFLPMAAVGWATKGRASVDGSAQEELIKMVGKGDLNNTEADWQALFHPDPVHTKGYALLAWAAEDLAATPTVDSWVHHLSAIQGKNGQWHNNLPRPPIQTGDISATALAVQALVKFPLPGRKGEFAQQVELARQWLWSSRPDNTESRAYQLLGLAWAGEPAAKLEPLAKALIQEQHTDGGWAQLPGLNSDAYATAQVVYALRVAAEHPSSNPAVDRGLRFLLTTQLEDGTWHVRRRAFPFQPTMDSGFPHGRDSWISAAASSWAVMALSVSDKVENIALKQ